MNTIDPMSMAYLNSATENLILHDFVSGMMGILTIIVVMILLSFLIKRIYRESPSEYHRSRMTDLYVIGMIRKFATQDGIDLEEEHVKLARMIELERISRQKLDKTIEQKLAHRITEDTNKKLGKQDKEDSKKKKSK